MRRVSGKVRETSLAYAGLDLDAGRASWASWSGAAAQACWVLFVVSALVAIGNGLTQPSISAYISRLDRSRATGRDAELEPEHVEPGAHLRPGAGRRALRYAPAVPFWACACHPAGAVRRLARDAAHSAGPKPTAAPRAGCSCGSRQAHATVRGQHAARHPARVEREQHRLSNLCRRACAPEWMQGAQASSCVLPCPLDRAAVPSRGRAHHGRVDDARRDHVHAHTRRELERKRARRADQRGLARGVGRRRAAPGARRACWRRARCCPCPRAFMCTPARWPAGTARHEVQLELGAQLRFADLAERRVAHDACRTARARRAGPCARSASSNTRVGSPWQREVSRQRDARAPAWRAASSASARASRARGDHRAPLRDQALHDGRADAARGARDERDLPAAHADSPACPRAAR